ncbi:MAG: 3-isopropylmalate dehydratase small subunit [Betaproteobacteria bacterium]|nr:3-isopropylmalate dehydratase small subunit [Betaproteobacteria bacterium]
MNEKSSSDFVTQFGISSCIGVAASLNRDNVDTDVIIPMNRILTNPRAELGHWAFAPLRYKSDGSEVTDFVLNQAAYKNAKILFTGRNFGCGSSREAAAIALREFGIRVVVAPSFGDIFRSNCVKNGIVPLVVAKDELDNLIACADEVVGTSLFKISLETLTIVPPLDGYQTVTFELDEAVRQQLMSGEDDISRTAQFVERIQCYQLADQKARSWLWSPLDLSSEAAFTDQL